MKTFRLLAVLCLATSAIACGGPVEDDSSDLSADDMKVNASEPITWVSMAQKAGARYAKDSLLLHVDGQIGPTDGFSWSFTFADFSTGNWVTVQCDGKTASVVEHHHSTARPIGTTALQLPKVKVTVAKLMKVSAAQGMKGRVGSIELSQALTADMHPHWFITQGGKEIVVDADTGSVLN